MTDIPKEDMPAHLASLAREAAVKYADHGAGYALLYGDVNAARLLFDAIAILFRRPEDKEMIDAMKYAIVVPGEEAEHFWDVLQTLVARRHAEVCAA